MNKLFLALSTAVISASVLTSCNKAPKANDSKAVPAVSTEMKIAYVEVDTIMSQYKFSKEYQAILQKKAQNIQNTLASKQQALEAAAAKLQQDYQANALTQEQAQTRQAAIQKQNADLQALNQRLSTEFQTETEKFNTALRDSIQNYLKVYNKDKSYSMILTKAGDNILYADKKYDITAEVVAGLNKVYKPAKTAKEDKKAKK
jgi:outer membrane protein